MVYVFISMIQFIRHLVFLYGLTYFIQAVYNLIYQDEETLEPNPK